MHHPHHHAHLHLLHFKINKELKEVYTSLALRVFAISLIGVFIPIYLYTLGYSITQILIYFVAEHFFHAFFSIFLAGQLAKRFGVKHLMLFSMPFLFIFIILAAFLGSFPIIPLYLLSLFAGLSNSLYWVGFHSEFAKFSDKKHRGREVGISNILASLVSAAGPFIGGLVIVGFGYLALYLGVLVILVLSVVPLFFSKDFSGKKKYMISKVFSHRTFRLDYIPKIVYTLNVSIFCTVWPLIIYFRNIFDDVSGIGFIFTLMFVFVVLFTIFASRISDKLDNYMKLFKYSGLVFVFIWIIRGLARVKSVLFCSEIFAGIIGPFRTVSLAKHTYNRSARTKNVIEYIVFSEAVMHLVAALLFIVLISFQDIFISPFIAALSNLLVLFI